MPLAAMLLSIAVAPLLAPHHVWQRWYWAVSAAWAASFFVPAACILGLRPVAAATAHVLAADYVPFLVLVGSLFVIAGGIVLEGPFRGTPRSNTALLLAGAVAASVVGTTGASMVLIRPILRANRHRRHRVHTIVFFIFLVSNVGGSLTPLGDPPLFLGFLRGVPFFWTTTRLLGRTAFLVGALLVVHHVIDALLARRDAPAPTPAAADQVRLRVTGSLNLVLLVAVGGVILASGTFGLHPVARDGALALLTIASLLLTPRAVRAMNDFSWVPLKEVAILFFGIFVTMTPVLAMLQAGPDGAFGPLIARVSTPFDYFWVTGSLSAFLDNAPTYVVFFEAARTGSMLPPDPILAAVSAGAVFMGAMTYIGNGPNFLVRSIAAEDGVRMPSFFGYLFKWSMPVLLPLLLVMTLWE